MIVRTAGSERSKPEIKRDYEYLLRLWDEIRELTLQLDRAGADLRGRQPDQARRSATSTRATSRRSWSRARTATRPRKDFMRMLMPSHAKRVQLYKDRRCRCSTAIQVESQLDAMHQPVVQLRSGGYIVINQTEALVAIDVNSGRATRERHIEETALRTNLEAADEIARQLRLRDLAGPDRHRLHRHGGAAQQHQVERRLKEALKNDRARIQIGRISPFGLLEMSRQRLRPSLIETSTRGLPALRRHRACPLDRIDGAASCCARSRRKASASAARPRSPSTCRPRSRSTSSTRSARR